MPTTNRAWPPALKPIPDVKDATACHRGAGSPRAFRAALGSPRQADAAAAVGNDDCAGAVHGCPRGGHGQPLASGSLLPGQAGQPLASGSLLPRGGYVRAHPGDRVNPEDALEQALAGGLPAIPEALDLREALDFSPALLAHAGALLQAFRRDAFIDQCRDWGDLMAYCRFSAVPVGRFLLDLHGETQPVVIHGIHHVFHPPVRLGEWPAGPRRSQLVLIVRGLQVDALAASFRAEVRGVETDE